MSRRASGLVADGFDGARIVFGVDGLPVTAARLAEAGSSYYSNSGPPTVGILLTNDRPSVEVLLGAMVAGASVVSLPPPGRGADIGRYAAHLADACREYGVEEVVAEDRIASLVFGVGPSLSIRPHAELAQRPLAAPSATGFRLVQFSSGSTAQPKPVVLDDAALGANLTAILAALEPQPGDGAVSWLPLSHDMGLVGMLLVSISAMSSKWARAGPVVLLDPAAFLRRPALWLEAIDRWGGTFTAAPNFGYEMATRRPASADLSRLRCAIVGGEISRAETLGSFTDCYRGRGFDDLALCPAYGMAEVGLAATMTPPDQHLRSRVLSTAALADGVTAPAHPEEAATVLVASGPPLPGYEIRCDAASGNTGQIAVRGPSIGIDGRTGDRLADADGWYRAGDAGFVEDGWLHVCGRTDDYIVAHGRNIYAPAVELAVGQVPGVRAGRVTTVGLPNGDWVIVAEPAGSAVDVNPGGGSLQREIRRAAVRLTAAQPDEVVVVPRGALPLTASGKLQRNEVLRRLLRHDLGSPPD